MEGKVVKLMELGFDRAKCLVGGDLESKYSTDVESSPPLREIIRTGTRPTLNLLLLLLLSGGHLSTGTRPTLNLLLLGSTLSTSV
jgi:hypothetical protein